MPYYPMKTTERLNQSPTILVWFRLQVRGWWEERNVVQQCTLKCKIISKRLLGSCLLTFSHNLLDRNVHFRVSTHHGIDYEVLNVSDGHHVHISNGILVTLTPRTCELDLVLCVPMIPPNVEFDSRKKSQSYLCQCKVKGEWLRRPVTSLPCE